MFNFDNLHRLCHHWLMTWHKLTTKLGQMSESNLISKLGHGVMASGYRWSDTILGYLSVPILV